jgi:hypothetical protein
LPRKPNRSKYPSIHWWHSHHHMKRGVPNRWLEGNLWQPRQVQTKAKPNSKSQDLKESSHWKGALKYQTPATRKSKEWHKPSAWQQNMHDSKEKLIIMYYPT